MTKYLLLTLCILLSTILLGKAKDDDQYVSRMPTVDQVIDAIGGKDQFDERGREILAFQGLESYMTTVMCQPRFELTKKELKLLESYHNAWGEIRDKVMKDLGASHGNRLPEGHPYSKWVNTYFFNTPMDPIMEEVRNKLFDKVLLEDFNRKLAVVEENRKQSSQVLESEEAARNPIFSSSKVSFRINWMKSIPVLVMLAFGLLMLLISLAGNRKNGLNEGYRVEGDVLITPNGRYNVHTAFGPAHSVLRSDTSRISGGYTVDTSEHIEFFVENFDGFDVPVKLVGWNIKVAEGHPILVAWANSRNGEKSFLHIRNFGTKEVKYGNVMRDMFYRSNPLPFWIIWTVTALIILAVSMTTAPHFIAIAFAIGFMGLLFALIVRSATNGTRRTRAWKHACAFADKIEVNEGKVVLR